MVVASHQTVGVADPAVTGDDLRERVEKDRAVGAGEKHRLASIASTGQVINSAGKLQAKRSCHEALASTPIVALHL